MIYIMMIDLKLKVLRRKGKVSPPFLDAQHMDGNIDRLVSTI